MAIARTDPVAGNSDQLRDLQLCRVLKTALGLKFSLRAARFTFTAPGQVVGTEISEDALLVLVATTLAAQPEIFSPSQIRPRRLKRIIQLLRALCADAGEDAYQVLEHFVERRLALQAGSDVTSGEVYASYASDAPHASESVLSKHDFFHRLPALIKRRFGLTQSHQVLRPSSTGRLTMRRGWRGLMLKDGTDAKDAKDAADGNLISPPVQNLEPIQL
jgi:hypothetical protein